MPALNFAPRFAPPVRSGEKCQSIRAPRKRPIHAGDRLYLYTGQRRPECRKLGEAIVESVETIRIEATGKVYVAGVLLTLDERRLLSRADGFTTYRAFLDWFVGTGVAPFVGDLIRWRLLPREEWRK
jgi:hypothetical protein